MDEGITYLNGAYMSPQLRSVEEAGIAHLKRKSKPYKITQEDFFTGKEQLRSVFAELISEEDPQRIAVVPSVSFGIATVLKNIEFKTGDHIVLLEEQFPSNYYSWKQLEVDQKVNLSIIKAPPVQIGRGVLWNQTILEAINSRTKVVSLPHVHWTDGTLFDLKAIRSKCDEVGAYLVIDGTQSVGALPFSVKEIRPDALICGGYKWLMGAYGLGAAYFGSRFDHGQPLDNNWMNHENSEDFKNLVNYNQNLKEKAVRYDVGESSNFILVPMLTEGIRQTLNWGPDNIQSYCDDLTREGLEVMRSKGYFIEDPDNRAKHLFGIHLNDRHDLEQIKKRIDSKNIVISYRGNSLRISPHVYNTKKEVENLISCFI